MPRVLNNNGVSLPIGTDTNSGDTPEESDIDQDPALQWTDAEWQAYQDEHYEDQNEYTEDEIARWEQDRRERRRARTRRTLSLLAIPSADGNPKAFALALATARLESSRSLALDVIGAGEDDGTGPERHRNAEHGETRSRNLSYI